MVDCNDGHSGRHVPGVRSSLMVQKNCGEKVSAKFVTERCRIYVKVEEVIIVRVKLGVSRSLALGSWL